MIMSTAKTAIFNKRIRVGGKAHKKSGRSCFFSRIASSEAPRSEKSATSECGFDTGSS